MNGIGRTVGPVLLSLLAGLTTSGCKQAVVVQSPSSRLAEIASSVYPFDSSLTTTTTNFLVNLGLAELARHDPRAVFAFLEPQLENVKPSPVLVLALAELAARTSNNTSLNSNDQAITWARDAALLAVSCLAISHDHPLDGSIWPTACAVHNQMVARCLRLAGTNRIASRNDWPARLSTARIQLASQVHDWTALGFDRLEPTNQFAVTGINPMGHQSGLGIPLIARRYLNDAQYSTWKAYGPDEAIFAATAIIKAPISLVGWRSQAVELTLVDPTSTDTINLGGERFPIAFDLTTPLASRLSQSSFRNYEYLGVVDPVFYNARAAAYAIDPYQPGKIPVLFLHGLWSGPNVWVPMLDALRADPAIRARFQFWVALYPSGYPLPIAAQSVRKSLREIRHRFDPTGADPALDQMIIIGKSTGGQITRMLVESSGPDLWNAVFTRPIHQLEIPSTLETDLSSAFFYEHESYIRTAVFVTTPHRGGNLARQPGARLGVNLIRQSNPLRAAWDDLQAANDPQAIQPRFRKSPPTSLDGMRAGNPILTAIDARRIDPNVIYHSIIASLHPGLSRDAMTDGFVRYSSAHLDGAASERIVTSSHLCEANPEVIAEIRKILLSQNHP